MFYNVEALHDLVIEIFFRAWKGMEKGKLKNIAIARRAYHKFTPALPFTALALVVGMVSVLNAIMMLCKLIYIDFCRQ